MKNTEYHHASQALSITESELAMSSLEIARLTGKRHDNVMRDIRDMLLKINKEAGLLKFEETYRGEQGKEYSCFLLPKRECLILVSGYNINLRAKIIDRWQELESNRYPDIPTSYAAALRLAASQAEELDSKNKLLLEQKPKVLFADAVSTSKTSILIGELAKLLKQNGIEMGQNRLFKWLRAEKYLIRRKGTDYNMPTQRSMELELFEIKETSISHSDGHVTVSKTPKVTGKGQQYFINLFLRKEAV